MIIPIANLSHFTHILLLETSADYLCLRQIKQLNTRLNSSTTQQMIFPAMQLSAQTRKKKSCKSFFLACLHSGTSHLVLDQQLLLSLHPMSFLRATLQNGGWKIGAILRSFQQVYCIWIVFEECTLWKSESRPRAPFNPSEQVGLIFPGLKSHNLKTRRKT